MEKEKESISTALWIRSNTMLFIMLLLQQRELHLKPLKRRNFDACMPVERIAMTGEKTLVFGPLKPKGLINPKLIRWTML
mgnify:CR=1 FL=1